MNKDVPASALPASGSKAELLKAFDDIINRLADTTKLTTTIPDKGGELTEAEETNMRVAGHLLIILADCSVFYRKLDGFKG